MAFGQVVIGPPGSGKTTYCWGLQQYFKAIGRKSIIINLDPAVLEIPYETNIDIRELNQFKRNLPGQIELSTDHQSLRNILHRLEKLDWRLAVVQLTDATHIVDAAKYVSIVLLNLKAMLNLGLPHINVLSKIDLLKGLSEEFKLNLDFYTDVQDLSYLLPLLDQQTTPKFSQLNRAMIDLIEDFNLVGFETLYVEATTLQLHLLFSKTPDQIMIQFKFQYKNPENLNQSSAITHLPIESLSDIQERWLDYPDEYELHQRQKWSEEGDLVFQKATEKSQADAIMQNQTDQIHHHQE
ncbi:hypothetical protein DFH28DRAFT_1221858 [Melampsora americana]|nr:hypothetical protein DFH28DRAFT_1221858 [Melampsora americana]